MGTLTLEGLTVRHGKAAVGAGVQNWGTLNVLHSTFLENVATVEGGAIDNVSSTNISNSTFSGNSANYGGGLMNNSGTAVITNSTFSGNTATVWGGALATYDGADSPPDTTVYNTIMANSSATEDCYQGDTGALNGSNNIIEDDATGYASCVWIITLAADPNLGSLTGAPPYFPLLAGSPAIDAGDPTRCSNAPVLGFSQNGIPRPQGPRCDIGAFELPQTNKTIKSTGTRDGWVLESTETSSEGGTKNVAATSFRLGDAAADKQYRSILSFSTATLPDDAVITSLQLKIRRAALTGSNPFASLGTIRVDMRRGAFGSSAELQLVDFQAAAHKANAASIPNVSSVGWYSKTLPSSNFSYINKTGVTQFRLRFATDDNDDLAADYLSFYSGEAASANRPALILTYYDPTP